MFSDSNPSIQKTIIHKGGNGGVKPLMMFVGTLVNHYSQEGLKMCNWSGILKIMVFTQLFTYYVFCIIV